MILCLAKSVGDLVCRSYRDRDCTFAKRGKISVLRKSNPYILVRNLRTVDQTGSFTFGDFHFDTCNVHSANFHGDISGQVRFSFVYRRAFTDRDIWCRGSCMYCVDCIIDERLSNAPEKIFTVDILSGYTFHPARLSTIATIGTIYRI